MTDKLKLRAESEEDLKIISSALQDAITRIGDIHYDVSARALTLRLSRFRHEAKDTAQRILSGLRVDSVLGLRTRGINRDDPDAMAVLLSLTFTPGETAPEGELHLVFAGGGELLAHIECIDLILADVSDPRDTDKLPLHPDVRP